MSESHQSVPPEESSHTKLPNSYTIRTNRQVLIPLGFMFILTSFVALGWPLALGWLYLIPIGLTFWVLRAGTTVNKSGLVVHRIFGDQKISWSNLKGIRMPKHGWARAVLLDETEVALLTVNVDRLRELAVTSHGHIPDPGER
ncbi:PH domain-containing protein [Smaragdicoccus niigatensis]|uniref:PH domain-containing protein n=1 Tax=Smaragdicoccus niigatensis TaxID=359359 RepID=UPI00035C52D9|nr:PH domain-containing protein [Smaragdicoccus niigatensis]